MKRLLVLWAASVALGLTGCGAAQRPARTLLQFGHVYDGRTMKPYQGKLPFQLLWPHAQGLNCFALYYPASGSSKQPPVARQQATTKVTGFSHSVAAEAMPSPPHIVVTCPVVVDLEH